MVRGWLAAMEAVMVVGTAAGEGTQVAAGEAVPLFNRCVMPCHAYRACHASRACHAWRKVRGVTHVFILLCF